MRTEIIQPGDEVVQYVKGIMVFDNDNPEADTVLPFFADGCPGIMYQVTQEGLFVSPHNKKMPVFFLYGQTIHPIELLIKGTFHLVGFQLYPSTVRSLFALDPKRLTDECYDLSQLQSCNVKQTIARLDASTDVQAQVEIISSLLSSLVKIKGETIDDKIQHSINLILHNRGLITVKELRDRLHITERTFERQFISQVGVSPKQFIRIIQFQTSLTQLTEKNYSRLTDVVFENGFADQSHFIKTFKKYTGKTPVRFQPKDK